MKKLILTDCFGVLVGELAPVWFAKRYPRDAAVRLKEHYFGSADLGSKTIAELIEDLSVGLGIEKNVIISELTEIFNVNDALFDYLDCLRKSRSDVDIALLSNAPEGLVESIFDKFGFWKYFDKTFVSWKYKMAKPDLKFYKFCISQMNERYDKIYMIDDNAKNLCGLEEIGVTPILFRGNEALFKQIEESLR